MLAKYTHLKHVKVFVFISNRDVEGSSENSMDKKYKKAMVDSAAQWFSDGRINKQKNIQLSLSSNLPLSNEMTFILVFSM